jgi:hypothetical protein
MLGRKTFTQEELDAAREAVAEQLAAADGADPAIFNGLLLALDRRFRRTVLKLEIGDPIRLTREQFDELSQGFFAELEAKYL